MSPTDSPRSTVAVLHAAAGDDAAPDAQDAVVEARAVAACLDRLGFAPELVPVTLDLQELVARLGALQPVLAFNLVEDVAGDGRLIPLAPFVLEHLKMAYTGAPLDAVYLTSNKRLTKDALLRAGIATPPSGPFPADVSFAGPYIVKSVWEDASVGLDEFSVAADRADLPRVAAALDPRHAPYFVERFIEGRELAVSVLEGPEGPEVLPIPETLFRDYPPGKPRVVGYRAKWDTDSFEYIHTPREWNLPATDRPMLAALGETSLKCWRLFGLRGYARVDFRVDETGQPWVIEVNANPCISPDAGFVAAAARGGLDLTTVVERIVRAAGVAFDSRAGEAPSADRQERFGGKP